MWLVVKQLVFRCGGPVRLGLALSAALFSPLAASAAALEQPVVYCRLPIERAPAEPLAGGSLPGDYGDGAQLVLLEPDGDTVDLAPGFAGACDPDVSFDGARILFAGKQAPGDPWNIWEVGKDGSGLRQITHETLDARHPLYLATFYTITSSEPWYTILFVRDDGVLNEATSAYGSSLYTVRLDGSELRRITFHPGNDRTPFLMQDGLLLFAGLRSGQAPADSHMRLFGIQTDGIDYAAYGATTGKRLQHWPVATTDGTVVFVEGDALGWDGAGRLGSVLTRRPHHSYRPLTEAGDGLFLSPSPLADGSVLVSRRLDGDVHRIVQFSPTEGIVETIHGDPAYHAVHARVVAPRPEPDGRSSTVRPESSTGKLFALDIYERDPAFAALEPGSARRLRVIEGVPRAESSMTGDIADRTLRRRLLGEAPVESDGSFHVDIPADLPVELQLVDSDGLALASCDWIWVKQREFRGCIGCHEDPELTPPNRFVEAAGRPATQLTLPPEDRRTVTFVDHVVPVLDSQCRACHQGSAASLALDRLDEDGGARAVYESLLGIGGPGAGGVAPAAGVVDPGKARTSPLIWRLLGRNTSRPWDEGVEPGGDIPTDHVDLLEPKDRTVFIEWIDLGAQWSSDADEGAEP